MEDEHAEEERLDEARRRLVVVVVRAVRRMLGRGAWRGGPVAEGARLFRHEQDAEDEQERVSADVDAGDPLAALNGALVSQSAVHAVALARGPLECDESERNERWIGI